MVVLAGVLTLVGFFQLLTGPYFDLKAKEENFYQHVLKIERENFSERASSINIMFSLVTADQINGYSNDWGRFSEIWGKHAGRLERIHGEIAGDVARGNAVRGEEPSSEQFCSEIQNIMEAQQAIEWKLVQIDGINIVQGGGSSIFGQALGPVVTVPALANNQALYSACNSQVTQGYTRLVLALALIFGGLVLSLKFYLDRKAQSSTSLPPESDKEDRPDDASA